MVEAKGARTVDDSRAYQEIEAQIGRGAGNIAATNFLHHTWLTESLADAARAMQLSLRSAWLLVEIWNNGATVWHSPAGDRRAIVTPEGDIQVESTALEDDAEQLSLGLR
jgi:hypothetical protein